MSRHRKYPKTTGWYVYKHVFPNDMYYPGISSQQPCDRWQPSHYNTTSARIYIEQFGWENVVHVIVADGLTKEEAEKLEDQLIEEGKLNGLCINAYRSGGEDAANERQREYQQTEKRKAYKRQYRERPENKEKQREYQRQYQREYQQTEKYKEHKRQYRERPENREKQREYQRQYYLKKKLEKTS